MREAVGEYLQARAPTGTSPEGVAALRQAYAKSRMDGYWRERARVPGCCSCFGCSLRASLLSRVSAARAWGSVVTKRVCALALVA